MSLDLGGLHHLTAVTARAAENVRFYTETLGMRLVKKTVNQDDTSAYHFFYGDGVAAPGSDITFFDWPAARERRGTHAVSRTALRVTGQSALEWWRQRLHDAVVLVGEIEEHNGRLALPFEDPEGQRLLLVDDAGAGSGTPWERSPVPAEYQIRGLGPITLNIPELAPTQRVLTELMNMRNTGEYTIPGPAPQQAQVFSMGPGGVTAELHIVVDPDLPTARLGAGGVHHVAFRTPDPESLHAWTQRVAAFGLHSSGEVERYYFQSLYFREPNGILFEIATDGPGFAVDESLDALGEALSLPPFLEERRAEIEAHLKPV